MASSTLPPNVRLVVPAALRGPLLEVVAELGTAVPSVEQLAMADLIGRGGTTGTSGGCAWSTAAGGPI